MKKYFLGLDIGTESVGYAATDADYSLLKHKGNLMWGVHLFEEASSCAERRNFRTSRRRLDRRQQRIKLLQEIFAIEISKIDPKFFIRIKESRLFPEDTTYGSGIFNDENFNDCDYNREYPTIHHLIVELIKNKSAHDVRLVYLACAWLVAHRGHFLNEISKENITDILSIDTVYNDFIGYFGEEMPWTCSDSKEFGKILKSKNSITKKYKELCALLFNAAKPDKNDGFTYSREVILKLLCGGKGSAKELFLNPDYNELESFTLDKSDDELEPLLNALGDDAELVRKLKALYDWSVLSDILDGCTYISESKIKIYNKHQQDLKNLKYVIRKYAPEKYNEMFRDDSDKKANYQCYIKNSSKHDDFCKYAKSIIKDIQPDSKDHTLVENMLSDMDSLGFCPKQVNSNNRVVPYQVYWAELKKILDNACEYLPFLKVSDNGITAYEKILSIFEYRVPYYVGPLNGDFWIKRKADGPIYPWNFNEMVDKEASEQEFIKRMTNSCTYLPEADVIPQTSLCYERFCVLNEINPISVNGKRITVQVKQKLFEEHFKSRKKVTKKSIKDFLQSNNFYTSDELETISGIDDVIKSSLSSYIAFKNLIKSGVLCENDVEQIIAYRTCIESKQRFSLWLSREYPKLSEADFKYICTLKFKNFGRLSREFLTDIYGTESENGTGEAVNILDRMWNENLTLMEVLSERYTYTSVIENRRAEYYGANKRSLDERLSDMCLSNPVKRSIMRTLDVVSDVVKANGCAPERIFIEMARGGTPDQKGVRTKSRFKQICELYDQCDSQEVRELYDQLLKSGEDVENRLQSDRLFLYYMQFGKCMYSGERIDLSKLSSTLYDIDHIYPRSKVKDDSVLNNKVLVLSTANGEKGDVYPIKSDIRSKMSGWWRYLKDNGYITEEKFKRLVRAEPFSEEEQWGFINRQLVETRQSTKAVASILSEIYPDSKIFYVKAGLVSEFRQDFDLMKCRSVNDLHHAKDAYLNIVVGNVYNERFTRAWFLKNRDAYNLKVKTLFTHPVLNVSKEQVWDGTVALEKVKDIVRNKNMVHFTRYTTCKKGGLFDQQPVKANADLTPLKKGLPTEKYGGYRRTAATFFVVTKYVTDKKEDVMIMPVELMFYKEFLSDPVYAEEYAKKSIQSVIKKEVKSVSFPFGKRQIRIGTVFEFDGKLRMYITAKSGGGSKLLFSVFTPLIIGYEWEKYIKRIEKFCEKKRQNPAMIYSEKYDGVTASQNIGLYDILCEKLENSVYKKIPANPYNTLVKGRDLFANLDIFRQSLCLLQIVSVFGRISGSDLSDIKGAPNSAVTTLSSSLSNWKKVYSKVCIVDTSASGIYRIASENLLEL